ncbi:MAG: Uma2 family endonuclease [Leptolyngbyaceae cyanobacterium RM2_2_4]|nr:Uma2 family endonuclease [Leptolyngbyaceae cyanobacterium SM1_4_3]NJO50189.1 Uma2 family endonuclease [Leptolyngbyaceae cyanobacterium RM2_2_4]
MTKTPIRMTFRELLEYDDGASTRHELINGMLIEMPPESEENDFMAIWLQFELAKQINFRQIRLHSLVMEVPEFLNLPKNRYPDLVVLQPVHIAQMRELGKLAITLGMEPPQLVVEIVSPGKDNRRRDYLEKRRQYEARGIPEYWIVDPVENQVVILTLTDGKYCEQTFRGGQRLKSSAFPKLDLSAEQIINAET